MFRNLINPIKLYDDNGNEIEPKVDPEDKQYLLLLFLKDGSRTFEVITGRSNVFSHIVEIVSDIDVEQSRILIDNLKKLADAKTVYQFMKYMQDNVYDTPGFDIDDYVDSEQEDQKVDSNESEDEDYERHSQDQISPLGGNGSDENDI